MNDVIDSPSTGEHPEVIKTCNNIIDKINKLINILGYENNRTKSRIMGRR